VQVGDVITAVDGSDVEQSADVRDAILEHDPGDTVELTIIRDGGELSLEVTLGRRGDGMQ
jgi:S1-C subfamily serine protease